MPPHPPGPVCETCPDEGRSAVIWRPKDGDRHLERQVGKLLTDARAAGDRRDLEGQVRLSGEAMDICRGLLERHPGDPRHLGALAGGLYNHAYRLIEVD